MTSSFDLMDTELPLTDDSQLVLEHARIDINGGGTLAITVRVFGENTRASLLFSDPVGLSYYDELFGSNGGQITRDERNRGNGWFCRSDDSNTLHHIKAICGEAFASESDNKSHFRLSLMNNHLDFIANKEYRFELIGDAEVVEP